MMFLSVRHLAPKRRAYRNHVPNCPAVTLGLSAITALAACGGPPRSANSSPTEGQLTIAAKLPTGTEGAPYSGSLSATGGTSPYKFVVTSGQMPQGVNLDDSGSISGTPTAAGNYNFAVTVSDAKGASSQQGIQIAVAQAALPPPPEPPPASPPPPSTPPPSGSPPSGDSYSNLQNADGWGQFGQGPPDFVDCSPSPCEGIEFSMTQGISSPSLSGKSAVFWLSGTAPYSDALFNNHIIGPYSSQGIPDEDESKTASLYHFTYDVDFYGDNLDLSEALEFDINQFFDGMGFVFGHQCHLVNGNQWDIWDASKREWIHTGVPCYPKSGEWNHLTLKVQRTSDNHQKYESITLNGETSTLNWTFEKGSSPGWYGVVINFQMDGNYKQDSYKIYLDNLTLTADQ
jgi:hypothetical protein